MADFQLTLGDENPVLKATATDADGAAVNLTGWTEPKLIVRHQATKTVQVFGSSAGVTVPDAAQGKLQKVFSPGELTRPGGYDFVFRLKDPAGRDTTFPNSGPKTLYVYEALD